MSCNYLGKHICTVALLCACACDGPIDQFFFILAPQTGYNSRLPACLTSSLTATNPCLRGVLLPLATEPPLVSLLFALAHTQIRFGLQPVDGNWVGTQSRKGGEKQPQVTFPPGVRVRLSGISLRNLSHDGDTRDRGVVVLAKDSS